MQGQEYVLKGSFDVTKEMKRTATTMALMEVLTYCLEQKKALLKKLELLESQRNEVKIADLNEVNANVSSDAIENPPFLLRLKIYGKNLHNWLVDSGAFGNVMPYSICQKLGLNPVHANSKIVELDKIEVNVIGELKVVYIQLSVDPHISHYINIEMVDIIEVYGMLLNRGWSKNLGGYFSTYFTYLWLPWKGVSNWI